MRAKLASQVGLEPTTLRLTARVQLCSRMLKIAISCLFSIKYERSSRQLICRDYPLFSAIFKQSPYKNPYSGSRLFPSLMQRLTISFHSFFCGLYCFLRAAVLPCYAADSACASTSLQFQSPFKIVSAT